MGLRPPYKEHISQITERECIDTIVNTIEAEGYQELESLIREGKKLQKGDKVYSVCMNKSIAMFQIGEKPMAEGMNILGAHIDSPRIDVKQNPLYEDGGFAYLDTHYYGGVKKYQWVALPLALHGVVVKKDGTTIEMNIGENDDDPVFFISDLLVHLAGEQMEKKASKVIEGEALDLIIGSKPIVLTREEKEEAKKEDKEKAKEAIKAGILDILKASYDMEEEDFLSAELEIVPAGKTREVGFDRSMILSSPPDLLDVSRLDVLNYAEKQTFEDLEPYLEGSSLLDREDFMENLLEGYTVDEKLVCVPRCFAIEITTGKTSIIGEEAGWTVKEFPQFLSDRLFISI